MPDQLGCNLCLEDQKYVLAAYVHRMTEESTRRFPAASQSMKEGGFRCPIISDAEWLSCTRFRVRKDGRLDARTTRCQTNRKELAT